MCRGTKLREFNDCKKIGLKTGLIQSAVGLETCLGLDLRNRIAKACDPTAGKIASITSRKCVLKGVDLSGAFPGCGTDELSELAVCLDRAIECKVCSGLRQADDLLVDCDLFDDGLSNGSCP